MTATFGASEGTNSGSVCLVAKVFLVSDSEACTIRGAFATEGDEQETTVVVLRRGGGEYQG